MSLWTASELVEATGGTLSGPFDAEGLSIDTRTIAAGELFVALIGEGRDGHAFVADALAKGAAGAIVHEDVAARPVLRVDDTLAALTRLGGFARWRFGGRLVAVTGSVGKTTTKEMLRCALSAFGSRPCSGRVIQQSLGRAADDGAHAARGRFLHRRDRHEPRRGDRAAGPTCSAACCRDHDHRQGAYWTSGQHRGYRRRKSQHHARALSRAALQCCRRIPSSFPVFELLRATLRC